MKRTISLLAFSFVLVAALDASAQTVVDAPSAPVSREMHRPDPWRLAAGARALHVSDPSLDPFAERDALGFFSVEGTKALAMSRHFAFAFGAAWDVGGSSATARGSQTSLTVHRLAVPLELRWHPTHWIYGFGRLAPGATSIAATVNDPASNTPLKSSAWVFSSDLTAGASLLLGPYRNPEKRLARVWLTPEVGYAWSTEGAMKFSPDNDDENARPVGSTTLGSLALRGLTYRVSLAMTF
jgi:hypothetical protein